MLSQNICHTVFTDTSKGSCMFMEVIFESEHGSTVIISKDSCMYMKVMFKSEHASVVIRVV